jgi:hypothetical protein
MIERVAKASAALNAKGWPSIETATPATYTIERIICDTAGSDTRRVGLLPTLGVAADQLG